MALQEDSDDDDDDGPEVDEEEMEKQFKRVMGLKLWVSLADTYLI